MNRSPRRKLVARSTVARSKVVEGPLRDGLVGQAPLDIPLALDGRGDGLEEVAVLVGESGLAATVWRQSMRSLLAFA
ncbi:hypothetical protein BN1708_007529 [Verticillium longisporum]|uniref:Uncharacterized protein n=1 Tax=Verticillium longisporum TaxID=100787 RepID=A0A0G4MUD8_VERLO|nr:hypothetical protein BN1708_007529 [Verticillium longisporum]